MKLTPQKLRAARAMLGLTQAAMAARSGVSESTIAGYENGKYKPRRATVAAWLRALSEAGVVLTPNGVEVA